MIKVYHISRSMSTVEKIISIIVAAQAVRSLSQLQYDNVSVLDYGVFISSVLALVVIGVYVWRKCHA